MDLLKEIEQDKVYPALGILLMISRALGTRLGTFIILNQGYNYTEEDIKEFCRGRLARYKIPKYIAFVKSYDMTASGKVQKFKLREKAAKIFNTD